MYEIDFLPVESEDGEGTKSGDAITARVTLDSGRQVILVIDGGYSRIGEDLVEHIDSYYATDHVDLIVSTHPDADHLSGLKHVLGTLSVGELLMHRPHLHASDVSEFSNLEAVEEMLDLARSRGVPVAEPFAGLTRWGGQLTVLGPTAQYYEEMVAQHLQEQKTGVSASRRGSLVAAAMSKGVDLLSRVLPSLPVETLGEDGETGPRNNSSAIILLRAGKDRIMFTGDAGIPALNAAADEYEKAVGPFHMYPLRTFQAPHHGSRRNLSPSLLDRVLGTPHAPFGAVQTPISSAKASPKHPSPRVVNALARRGGYVVTTEGRKLCLHDDQVPPRVGWSTAVPLPPLVEDDEDQ